MTPEELADLRSYKWMSSRTPAIDALSLFVPEGHEENPDVAEMTARVGSSRWYPVPGGHKVLFPTKVAGTTRSGSPSKRVGGIMNTARLAVRAYLP